MRLSLQVSILGGISASLLILVRASTHQDILSSLSATSISPHPDLHLHPTCPKPPSQLLLSTPNPQSAPRPWTHAPACIETNVSSAPHVCLYTNSSFALNRGISILTTPDIAAEIASLPAFTAHLPTTYLPPAANPAYAIRPIAGKGLGLVATRMIHRGERIFAVPIVGIYHVDTFLRRRRESPDTVKRYARLFEESVVRLPRETRERFWALAAHEDALKGRDGKGVVGRLNTNTFAEDFGEMEHSIAAPETAVSILSRVVVEMVKMLTFG